MLLLFSAGEGRGGGGGASAVISVIVSSDWRLGHSEHSEQRLMVSLCVREGEGEQGKG